MSRNEELKMEVDFNEHKTVNNKPPIADKLQKESQELQKKRQSLSKEDVEGKLREAEERRLAELEKKKEVAKQLEGEKGKVDPTAAAKDAPPAGKELPHSPINKNK